MTVSHEIKSQLAKLLATEDLVVEHKNVQTACFNVHTRVLTLPMWDKASNVVYDMLVGHEVGHALYTPDENWLKEYNIPPQFVNVVEDARIEKLMKRKYLGLSKTFYGGYKELSEKDFFELEGEDISKMNLADRANLYFKIGNYVDIPFDDYLEMPIIRMIEGCETFADTLIAAEALYKFCKKNKEDEKLNDIPTPPQNSGNSNSEESEETNENPGKSEGSGDSEEKSDSKNPSSDSPEVVFQDEPEVSTANNLEENLLDLVDTNSFDRENVYLEIPKLNLQTVIAPNTEIHSTIDNYFNTIQERSKERSLESGREIFNPFERVDSNFAKFKRSAQKEVNYLVKEFECRKSADSYARASVSRTGVLDCTKLHTYKYNEDLFKKVTTLADGKNHGLIFVLDWSGSMAPTLLDTCKQLFNLIWFCKKVSIPFDVYAFTNEWNRTYYDYEQEKYIPASTTPHYVKKEGLLSVANQFSMLNMLSSKSSLKELEHQMLNIWRIACYYGNVYSCYYSAPERLSLSGTPLNESLVALHEILPKFQQENKLQKVQCVILTDGEANHLTHHVEIARKIEEEPYIGTRRISPHVTFIRDRKLGTTYKVGYGWHEFTDLLLRNLKDKFPSVNFIGIRVLASRDANSFIRLYHNSDDKEFQSIQTDWKKLKSFKITKSGYDAYFGMSATSLAQECEFDVKEDATKSQIKTAFAKSLKVKKLNKKVLGEFISLVS
tara:strand:+ start:1158 stop:3323 length:2166 start_codon:yes stop_codon:yes gene_type:complete